MSKEVTGQMLLRLSEAAGIRIARKHRAGVRRNLEIVLGQAEILTQAPLDPFVEPAPVFVP